MGSGLTASPRAIARSERRAGALTLYGIASCGFGLVAGEGRGRRVGRGRGGRLVGRGAGRGRGCVWKLDRRARDGGARGRLTVYGVASRGCGVLRRPGCRVGLGLVAVGPAQAGEAHGVPALWRGRGVPWDVAAGPLTSALGPRFAAQARGRGRRGHRGWLTLHGIVSGGLILEPGGAGLADGAAGGAGVGGELVHGVLLRRRRAVACADWCMGFWRGGGAGGAIGRGRGGDRLLPGREGGGMRPAGRLGCGFAGLGAGGVVAVLARVFTLYGIASCGVGQGRLEGRIGAARSFGRFTRRAAMSGGVVAP